MEESLDEVETKTFFGRCICCMEYGYMKNMWIEHYWEGEREIYGEMLMETFSIVCNQLEKLEQICEVCVTRLRDAFNFKKDVQASLNLLQEDSFYNEGNDTELQEKKMFQDNQSLEEEYLEEDMEQEVKLEHLSEPEYQEIEYLEEDEALVAAEITKSQSTESTPASKCTKKERKGDVKATYKNYNQADLRRAVEAVINNELTVVEASERYCIPRRTINTRITYLKNRPDTLDIEIRQLFHDKRYRFVEETKVILAYTNLVPFKVRRTRLYCAYCEPSPVFDDPEQIRIHTYDKHKHQIANNLDIVLRPHWLNEVIRVDITNMACNECYIRIPTWNELFEHLRDTHNVELDEAYTRVIPYKLTNDHKCALCDMNFSHFHFLDAHMNAHYNNYVCADCGDTFITECRLKKHVLIHSNERFPCQECGKVFTLNKYRTKHVNFVHKTGKHFKCLYCDCKYSTELERHMHVVKEHKEKVKTITCEICGLTFTWRAYYLAHVRKKHSTDKKFKCEYCLRQFVSRHDLKMHIMRHKGQKTVECSHCDKKFVTKAELRSHAKTHNKLTTVLETPASLVVICPAPKS
ncbi:zinc finger protein 546-like isoform X2 [Galleria mellonella]|uniref:Zinc finger protein 546-like isoform X2 n=1 Tax=Galleria mellonella TaxID=7137 RepID=A0ABM3N0W3_GALME|nr:zinc finger protein 546-like isoform X2 [Galleria mellonella]